MISGLMLLLKWSGIHIPSWIFNASVQYFWLFFLWRYITKERKHKEKKQIYEVTLIYQDKTFSVKALYDSGKYVNDKKK